MPSDQAFVSPASVLYLHDCHRLPVLAIINPSMVYFVHLTACPQRFDEPLIRIFSGHAATRLRSYITPYPVLAIVLQYNYAVSHVR